MNAAGLDRLGIVSDVTGLVIDHGGNVGESVAGRLGSSYFSLMMLVTVPEERRESLQEQILAVPDLHAAVFLVDDHSNDRAVSAHKPQIGCALCTVKYIYTYIYLTDQTSLAHTLLPAHLYFFHLARY